MSEVAPQTVDEWHDVQSPASVIAITTPRIERAGGTRAASLTIVTPIKLGDVDDLRQRLADIETHEARLGKCPLRSVHGIHLLRWVILPAAVRDSGVVVPESLVFWTVIDGDKDEQLRTIISTARTRLDDLYQHCVGYTPGMSADQVEQYFRDHTVTSFWSASFDAAAGRTSAQITAEAELNQAIRGFLRSQDWTDRSQSHAYLETKAWLKTQAAFARAFDPPKPPPPPWWWRPLRIALWVLAAGLLLGMAFATTKTLAVIGAVAGALALWLYLLSRRERREELDFVPPSRAWFASHDAEIARRENEAQGVNRLTILTDLQPGFVRAVTMRAILWIVNLSAAITTGGALQGVETIHAAQWRLVDGGRRLLFMSNYDGRADDYFRDFSDNAAPGVNAIWSNTVGFPPTQLLIGKGSRDLPTFQQAARTYQIPTDVWYLGYSTGGANPDPRGLTINRINGNTRVRAGLSKNLTPPDVSAWLATVDQDV